MNAAGIGGHVDGAGDVVSVDAAGIGPRINAPLHIANMNAAGIGAHADIGTNIGSLDAAGIGLAVHRTFNAIHGDSARIRARSHFRLGRGRNLQPHGNVAQQRFVADIAYAYGGAVLLDRRVLLQPPNVILGVASGAQPAVLRFEDARDAYNAWVAARDADAPGVGHHVQIHRSAYVQRPLEPPLRLPLAEHQAENRHPDRQNDSSHILNLLI